MVFLCFLDIVGLIIKLIFTYIITVCPKEIEALAHAEEFERDVGLLVLSLVLLRLHRSLLNGRPWAWFAIQLALLLIFFISVLAAISFPVTLVVSLVCVLLLIYLHTEPVKRFCSGNVITDPIP